MKRGGFKRKVYEPAPADPGRITRSFTTTGSTTGPAPKSPADRNPKLLELAKGEECTLLFPLGACDPATTVWAHPNGLGDNKGAGYKGNDSAGVFACYRCHKIIDQPGPSDPAALIRENHWRMAVLRTAVRLLAIAGDPASKPWKITAAKWALERLKRKDAHGNG